ncbi:MAG: hypothetical protein CBR30_05770 [Dictyoglomus sp. NZ13-RE01]|nr:MAG: hypothetical protein CBR30_05770 [Dictyoglomus sp. NZ13-RE01]
MKRYLFLSLIIIMVLGLVYAQTSTQTQTNQKTRPATIFVLHIESFSKVYKSNFEKNVKAFDETFKFGSCVYHPITGLVISCYTQSHKDGLPYPTLANRVLKELLPILNDITLPPKTMINIIVMVEDKKDPFNGKTLFIGFPYSALKDYMSKKDQDAFAKQMVVALETEKLNYNKGTFVSTKYDWEWILKL